jgi:DNA-binding response OmpR family regulator
MRELQDTADIPVIILSADATSQQIERLLAAGALYYLTKPLDVRHFLEIIDSILRKDETLQ